jgi:hypothetical protein
MNQPHPRLYLNVPYAEKDAAKQLGARWDAEQKKWFAPSGIESVAFERWLGIKQPPQSTLKLPSTGIKLTSE